MKNKIRNIKYGLLVVLFTFMFSCNENDFLEEVPSDFIALKIHL